MSETETYNWKLSPGGGMIMPRHGGAFCPSNREIIEYVAKLELEIRGLEGDLACRVSMHTDELDDAKAEIERLRKVVDAARKMHSEADHSRAYERSDDLADAMDEFRDALTALDKQEGQNDE